MTRFGTIRLRIARVRGMSFLHGGQPARAGLSLRSPVEKQANWEALLHDVTAAGWKAERRT